MWSAAATAAYGPVAATLASTFTVAYSMRFVHDVFFGGAPRGLPKTPHEPPLGMKIPVVVLVALCLAVGLAPGVTVEGPPVAVAKVMALALVMTLGVAPGDRERVGEGVAEGEGVGEPEDVGQISARTVLLLSPTSTTAGDRVPDVATDWGPLK